ncbi:hypothetical protein ACX1N5_01640 [Acinetobacter sp. ANC 4636]
MEITQNSLQALKQYSYKPKKWGLFIGLIIVSTFAYFYWVEMKEPSYSLVIYHIIKLSPSNTQIFNLFAFILSFCMAVAGFFVLFRKERHLILTANSIRLVKNGLSSIETEIPFSTIKSLQLQTIYTQRFLCIVHTNGKLTIVESALPSKQAFEEICRILMTKTRT